jgi:hypothetical protein
LAKLNRKYTSKEGVEYCYCVDEQVFHPCTSFFVDRKTSTGFMQKCKECNKKYLESKKLLKNEPKETDRELANIILSNLGYDTTQDIHKQFLQKHNL